MIPTKTIEELILKHSTLEKDLSSGDLDKKLFAEKSKEYSDVSEVIVNAKRLKVDGRTKFYKSDIDKFVEANYDLIISNPPYIKSCELKYLESDVIKFEPKLALDGGVDGLSEIRKVIKKSSELIKKNGKFVLEIGFNQKNKVVKLLKEKGFYINCTLKDLALNDRCIVSTKI